MMSGRACADAAVSAVAAVLGWAGGASGASVGTEGASAAASDSVADGWAGSVTWVAVCGVGCWRP